MSVTTGRIYALEMRVRKLKAMLREVEIAPAERNRARHPAQVGREAARKWEPTPQPVPRSFQDDMREAA